MRLGPLNFDAVGDIEAIYTTNVDGVRPSATDKEMTDYYIMASFGLKSTSPILRGSKLSVDTGIATEKHFVRDDLDTLSEPFGRGRIDTELESGRYTLALNAYIDKTANTREGTFVPGSLKKKRDVRTDSGYGADLSWTRGKVTWKANASTSSTRHDDPEYQIDDHDRDDLGFGASWALAKRLSLRYDHVRNREQLVNQRESYSDWDYTESAGLVLQVLERPVVAYTLGTQRESTQGEVGGWEMTHDLTLSDSRQLTKKLDLSADISYHREGRAEATDIATTFHVGLQHQISRTARQSLDVTREPVETFGSTTETDSTTIRYQFYKNDLFMYYLNLVLGVQYGRDEPLGKPTPVLPLAEEAVPGEAAPAVAASASPVEETWAYTVNLSHSRALSRRTTRSLVYDYSYEESNRSDEPLEEHRATLKYTHMF